MDMKQKCAIKCLEVLTVYLSFLLVTILLNGNYILRSSVLDDFNLIKRNCTNFVDVFFDNYKFRPISALTIGGVSNLAQGNTYVYGWCNLMIHSFLATNFYYMFRKMFDLKILSYIGGLAFVISYFSYYQITTQYGVMEATATFFSIVTVFLMYMYVQNKQNKYFYLAVLTYFLAVMSHERYIVLFPVLFMIGVYDLYNFKEKKINLQSLKRGVMASVAFVASLLIFMSVMDNIFMGTGAQSVTSETLEINLIGFFFRYIGYLFMINPVEWTETYLCMISWGEYPQIMKCLIIVSIVIVVLLAMNIVYHCLKSDKENRIKILLSAAIFVLSICAIAVISSTTIRVELRWVYVSFIIMLMLLMYSVKVAQNIVLKWLSIGAVAIYFLISIMFSLFARENYSRLYYWNDYETANSLYDCTYKEYKETMYDKEWVIITNSLDYDYLARVMDSYDIYDEYSLSLNVVHSLEEAEKIEIGENTIVLLHSTTEFSNITDVFSYDIPVYTTLYEDNYIGTECTINLGVAANYLCTFLEVPEGMENSCTVLLDDIPTTELQIVSGRNELKIPLNGAVKVDLVFQKGYDINGDGRMLCGYVSEGFWIE